MKTQLSKLNLPHSFFFCCALISGILANADNIILAFLFQITNILNYFKIENKLIYIFFIFTFTVTGFFRTQFLKNKYFYAVKCFKESSNPIIGTITNIEDNNHVFFNKALTLKLISNQDFPINGLIKLFLNKLDSIEIGDIIEIENLKQDNFNNNRLVYSLKENIIATKFLPKLKYKKINQPKKIDLKKQLYNYRNFLNSNIKNKMNKISWSFYSKIFLGAKNISTISNSINKMFQNWGLSHFLARSGLHVILILIIWSMIFKCIPLNFKIKNLFLIAILTIYNILTFNTLSFSRALISFLLYKSCNLKYLPIHSTHIISLTCILILLYNPFHLFFLEFQLTFLLSFALSIYNQSTTEKNHLLPKTIEPLTQS